MILKRIILLLGVVLFAMAAKAEPFDATASVQVVDGTLDADAPGTVRMDVIRLSGGFEYELITDLSPHQQDLLDSLTPQARDRFMQRRYNMLKTIAKTFRSASFTFGAGVVAGNAIQSVKNTVLIASIQTTEVVRDALSNPIDFLMRPWHGSREYWRTREDVIKKSLRSFDHLMLEKSPLVADANEVGFGGALGLQAGLHREDRGFVRAHSLDLRFGFNFATRRAVVITGLLNERFHHNVLPIDMPIVIASATARLMMYFSNDAQSSRAAQQLSSSAFQPVSPQHVNDNMVTLFPPGIPSYATSSGHSYEAGPYFALGPSTAWDWIYGYETTSSRYSLRAEFSTSRIGIPKLSFRHEGETLVEVSRVGEWIQNTTRVIRRVLSGQRQCRVNFHPTRAQFDDVN